MTHSKFPTLPPKRARACMSQSRDFVNSLDTSQTSVFSAFDFLHDSNIAGKKGFRFIRKCNYSLKTTRIEYTHNEEKVREPKVWCHFRQTTSKSFTFTLKILCNPCHIHAFTCFNQSTKDKQVNKHVSLSLVCNIFFVKKFDNEEFCFLRHLMSLTAEPAQISLYSNSTK